MGLIEPTLRCAMRLTQLWLPVIAIGAFFVPLATTEAQSADAIQKFLAQQAKGCSLYGYREYFRGTMPGANQPIGIASYTIEGCNGGNGYARTIGVFYEAGGKIRQMKRPSAPIVGPDVDDPTGVTVQGDQITIQYSAYAPDDARCCPSLKKTAHYKLANDAIVPTR
jgi:hypothetical protein